jgi:hypothetical protein
VSFQIPEGSVDLDVVMTDISMKSIPLYSYILVEDEIFSYSSVNYSFILTTLASNYIPLINDEHMVELKDYQIEYTKVGQYNAITYINFSDPEICSYFS